MELILSEFELKYAGCDEKQIVIEPSGLMCEDYNQLNNSISILHRASYLSGNSMLWCCYWARISIARQFKTVINALRTQFQLRPKDYTTMSKATNWKTQGMRRYVLVLPYGTVTALIAQHFGSSADADEHLMRSFLIQIILPCRPMLFLI
jgi:hypothetical protein